MSGQIDKRRKRSRDDEICDTPLSKRINNLHLNNSSHNVGHNSKQMSKELNGFSKTVPPLDGRLGDENGHYNPELNETQNPFYFDKNKLLHELHLERLKRGTAVDV